MEIKDDLVEIFKSRSAGPFLFVGSGFSRRYLGLEDWRGLLTRFCVAGQPFEYYLSKADGYYPTASKLLANDFNEYWWKADEYKENVSASKSNIVDATSALRIEICKYLTSLDQKTIKDSNIAKELEYLAELNVDGVITTNWDVFLEKIFPEYKVYIGQNELLFSNPQEIGEIYKIHGCSTKPNSLVLTDTDYNEFENKNAYLAAKLITLFVEHPIVFMGYSISDKNICGLLKAISLCIGKDNIEQLRKNLIFVQRLAIGEQENISHTSHYFDDIQIPIISVKTNDFNPIYEAINLTKRKIPARILRYCKEQMYELVQSSSPEEKICVVDIEEIASKDDIEFLVGVGVISKHKESVSKIGYSSIQLKDLIADLLHENRDYDSRQIIDKLLPKLIKKTCNTPVFKYLKSIEIDSDIKYSKSGLSFDESVKRDLDSFKTKIYDSQFQSNCQGKSMSNIINSFPVEKVLIYIPFITREEIDVQMLKEFLIQNEDKINSKHATSFRKLAALYDRLKWGW
jgi:SIR2-like domain